MCRKIYQKLKLRKFRACKYSVGSSKTHFVHTMLSLSTSYKHRQVLHEQIRKHSMESARIVKMEGKPNDLLDRIAQDPLFGLSREDLDNILNISAFIGRAPAQVFEFIENYIDTLLQNASRDYGNAQIAKLKV